MVSRNHPDNHRELKTLCSDGTYRIELSPEAPAPLTSHHGFTIRRPSHRDLDAPNGFRYAWFALSSTQDVDQGKNRQAGVIGTRAERRHALRRPEDIAVQSMVRDKTMMKDITEAEIMRAQLVLESAKHEDDLLNHRMTWMWTLQGLLFTALGLLWKVHPFPACIVSIVGLASCVSIGFSLRCSVRALHNLDEAREWASSVTYPEQETPMMGLGKKEVTRHYMLPWNVLPWLMGVAWACMPILILTLRSSP